MLVLKGVRLEYNLHSLQQGKQTMKNTHLYIVFSILIGCTSSSNATTEKTQSHDEICETLAKAAEERNAGTFAVILSECLKMDEPQIRGKIGELEACETNCAHIFDGGREPGKDIPLED